MSVPIDPEVAAGLHRDIASAGITNPPGPLPLRPPGTFGPGDKGDPAYWMLLDGFTTTPSVHLAGCYICEDPEFAQMGLPLCRKCPECVRQGRGAGHIAADDNVCDSCGYEDGPQDYPEAGQEGS
jgi:hypothetical protein